MMIDRDLHALADTDFPAYVAAMNRRLRLLDRALEQVRVAESPDAFRLRIAGEAVADLAALGVPRPKLAWRLGVVATRMWILELATELTCAIDRRLPTWRGAAIAPGDSPAGEFALWRHIAALAEGVRERRARRGFGLSTMTPADFEEARLGAQIPNDQWAAIRERAAWVLAR